MSTDDKHFGEPWQAEVVAVTVELSRRGVFAWHEWVAQFAREIEQQPQTPSEDVNAAYYRQWLSALERLLCEKGVTSGRDIAATAEAWRRSYLHTEHGQPVEFRRGLPPAVHHTHEDDHDHSGAHAATPVAVSPAGRQRGVAFPSK